MRTHQQFANIFESMKYWHNLHKKPVWLVARENDYVLSVIKPEPHQLPTGTAANLYGPDQEILETVKSSN